MSDIRRLDAADPRVPSGLRPNVVARIPGRSSRTLWLFAHMDVVPPGDPALWHSDPWLVVRQGDMLVGRGVEDNQQGLVSMLLLAEALHACDITPELSLGLVFMADEECGNDYGLAHVLERHAALPEEQRFLRADDFYIVPDSGSPTGADIEVAEKCLCWLKVDVSGVQCHASTPHKGRNAFVAGAAAVLACMELHKDFPRRDALFDPACSTFVPSRHDANVPSVNILPGHDTFYVDCRLLPGVEPEHVLDAARRRLTAVAEHHGVRIDVVSSTASAPRKRLRTAPWSRPCVVPSRTSIRWRPVPWASAAPPWPPCCASRACPPPCGAASTAPATSPTNILPSPPPQGRPGVCPCAHAALRTVLTVS